MTQHSRRPLRVHTPSQWQEIIEDFKKSSLNKSDFCKQRGLTPSAFARWEKRILTPHAFQKRTRHVYTSEQQKGFIEDWRKSDLSKYAYCVQKNIAPSAFNGWVKKFASLDPSPQPQDEDHEATLSFTTPESATDQADNPTAFFQEHFVPLSLSPTTPNDSSSSNQKIEIVFAHGHRLFLQGSFDLELLGSWLTPLLTNESEK